MELIEVITTKENLNRAYKKVVENPEKYAQTLAFFLGLEYN